MFKDINISKDLMGNFKSQHPTLEMSVKVLSRGIWPEWPIIELSLPEEILRQQKCYEQFYSSKFNNRKLTWQNAKAKCAVAAAFKGGNKTFFMSLIQSLVILCFNSKSRLTYKEIRETIAPCKALALPQIGRAHV